MIQKDVLHHVKCDDCGRLLSVGADSSMAARIQAAVAGWRYSTAGKGQGKPGMQRSFDHCADCNASA